MSDERTNAPERDSQSGGEWRMITTPMTMEVDAKEERKKLPKL